MDKRKILILSLLGLGILGTPVFSQNELTVTNMSVYVIPVLNFTFDPFTFNGTNVFAVSHYTYNDTPYILAVLGADNPISVNLFNITGGLVASKDISDVFNTLMSQTYFRGSILIYERDNVTYITIPFYKFYETFYEPGVTYANILTYLITINGTVISDPIFMSNLTLKLNTSYPIYYIYIQKDKQYIITKEGVYLSNGTLLAQLHYPSIISTKHNIYIIDLNNEIVSLDYGDLRQYVYLYVYDINLEDGNFYIVYNNTYFLPYSFPGDFLRYFYVSRHYPKDYLLITDTLNITNILINNNKYYNLSSDSCKVSLGTANWIYDNYFGSLVLSGNVSITVYTFNITNDVIYCSPYLYNDTNVYQFPNPYQGLFTYSGFVSSVIPIYYNGSDLFILTSAIYDYNDLYATLYGLPADSIFMVPAEYLYEINLNNLSVSYSDPYFMCYSDNYLIACLDGGETDIYVVSGQPLTPTPTQIYYDITSRYACYPQQLNYTNFTAYLLHIFNVTFNQTNLSGARIFTIYPYTYNNNPYILAIVGTVYPQLVSLFNITGGLIATKNISNLVQNLTSQGYFLGKIFIYEYNDKAYISIPFITDSGGLLYEMTLKGNTFSNLKLVSNITYGEKIIPPTFTYTKIGDYIIFGGTFYNSSLHRLVTNLHIFKNNETIVSLSSGYYHPAYSYEPEEPVQLVETKDYIYIIFDTGNSNSSISIKDEELPYPYPPNNEYLFVFAINKATGQLYTLVNGTRINGIKKYPYFGSYNIDYYKNILVIPIAYPSYRSPLISNFLVQYYTQQSILIFGNTSLMISSDGAFARDDYIALYRIMPGYNITSNICINIDVYNYIKQNNQIMLTLVNKSSILDSFGFNNDVNTQLFLMSPGPNMVVYSKDIESAYFFSIILNLEKGYQAPIEFMINPLSKQYSYIVINTPGYCSQTGYLIYCESQYFDPDTDENIFNYDVYVLSALNLTPTPVDVLLTTPTTPLQYTIPTQTSAPSPTTTTTAPTTSAPSVSVPAGYSTTAQSTVSIPPYSIFVAIIVGAVLVGWYYARKKYLG